MDTDTIFTLRATDVKFGRGATAEVGDDLGAMGCSRAAVVVDPALRAASVMGSVSASLQRAGIDYDVFDRVHCEPTDVAVKEAIRFAIEGRYDGFLAVGGGSTIDTAKMMDLYSTYPADFAAYFNEPIGEGRPVPGPLKPLIGVPTTSGTSAESTSVAIVDFLDLKLKTGISHRHMRPSLALLDPDNTISAPPGVTASTGIDVLTHAAESYTARPYYTRRRPARSADRPPYVGSNPVSDVWCRRAIQLVREYLPRAIADGTDIEAREQMMLACLCAGLGFGNAGVHIPHAMGYPIAGMVRGFRFRDYPAEPMIAHGISTALGSPASLRFTARAAPRRHAEIATWLGREPEGNDPESIGRALTEGLVDLMRQIGLPSGLRAVGYEESDIPALVDGTMKQQRLLAVAPCPVVAEDVRRIFEESMENW